MFCPNCGKELNNDAQFCGFCGEKIALEENATPIDISTDATQTIAQPEETVQAEQPVQTEQPAQEPQTTVNEQANTTSTPDWQNTVKSQISKIKADDFKVYLTAIKDPIQTHEMKIFPTVVIYVLFVIFNMIFLSNFLHGLLVSALIVGLLVLLDFLNDRKQFNIMNACTSIAQILIIPTICMLVVNILMAIGSSLVSNASYFDMSGYQNALRVIQLALYLLGFSVITFFVITTKKYKNINTYVLILVYLVFGYIMLSVITNIAGSYINYLF